MSVVEIKRASAPRSFPIRANDIRKDTYFYGRIGLETAPGQPRLYLRTASELPGSSTRGLVLLVEKPSLQWSWLVGDGGPTVYDFEPVDLLIGTTPVAANEIAAQTLQCPAPTV